MSEPAEPETGVDAPLRIGMVLAPTATSPDGGEAAQPVLRARLRGLAVALAAATGIPTIPHDFDDYPALLEAMYEGELDVAWLPPVVAMRAASAGRALPIVLPVRRGISSFHSALFTQVGSPFQRPPDLVGARAAWVDRKSASGFLVIRAALRAQGVDFERAFSEEHFVGSHRAVVRAVLDGSADVGATFLHHDPAGTGIWRAGWGDANVHIVARVGPIPSDVIASGVHVPVAHIKAVRQVLTDGQHPELASAAAALLEADRFIPAESEHLKPLEDLLDFLEDAARTWHSMVPPPNVRLTERAD